jgi:hypothetical protein
VWGRAPGATCNRPGAPPGHWVCVNTPHDQFFHKAFDNPDRARELLRVALPERIARRLDLESLTIRKGIFVDSKVRRATSDLLLETRTLGRQRLLIYILLEHKSKPDRSTMLQLLRYMVSIWESWSPSSGNRRWRLLPPIIPIIFSHAKQRWTYPLDFAALVRRPAGMDLGTITPSFSALLLDLAATPDNKLGRDKLAIALLQMLKHVHAGSVCELTPALAVLGGPGGSSQRRDLLIASVSYLAQAGHGASLGGILDALPSEGDRRMAMTIAERLERKGRRQGRTQGREEGRIDGKQELLERQLERKFGLTERQRNAIRAQRDPKRLEAAIDAILFADSKEGVLALLR